MQAMSNVGASAETAEARFEQLSRRVEELETAMAARPGRRHRRIRAGRAGRDGSSESGGVVTRRRLFGLLGGAAAAGAGLAVAGSAIGADPAEASGTMM